MGGSRRTVARRSTQPDIRKAVCHCIQQLHEATWLVFVRPASDDGLAAHGRESRCLLGLDGFQRHVARHVVPLLGTPVLPSGRKRHN